MAMEIFEVKQNAPDLDNAYSLAWLAKAAYKNDPLDTYPELGENYKDVLYFRRRRVFGYVASTSTDVVVAFRGTDELQDWLEAVVFSQADWAGGRVHQGMAEALDGVWQQIMAAFFDVAAHEKAIWLTGHSLGGALATLAAYRLNRECFEVRLVCTYGAPRVIGAETAREFDFPMVRFANNEDPIPDLPWPTLFDTYVHVGEPVLFMPSGRIAEKRHSPDLARRIDRAETIGEGILPSGMYHDHLLDNYIGKLRLHLSHVS